MFRRTKGVWTCLLQASVQVIIARYGITHGVIVVDDSDKRRAKQTKRIYHAHKIKDKKSGGFINGQSIVLILCVTPQVTLPVGIDFYMPDPELTAWNTEEKRLKQQGVAKKLRPEKPKKNPNYPTIPEIALQFMEEFHTAFPHIIADCVLADNLYGTHTFLDKASATFDGTQSISTLKKSQHVRFQGKKMTLPAFFTRYPGTKHTIRLRGGKDVTAWVSSARLHVRAPLWALLFKRSQTSKRYALACSTLSNVSRVQHAFRLTYSPRLSTGPFSLPRVT